MAPIQADALTEVKVIGRTELASHNSERLRFINPNKPGTVEKALAQIAARIAFDTWKNNQQSPAHGLEKNRSSEEGE